MTAPKVRPAVSIAQGLVAADTGLTNISVNNFVTLWEIVPGANFSRALDIDSIREVMNAPRTTQVEIITGAGHRCEARITTDILYNEAWQKTALEQQPGVEGVVADHARVVPAMIANASRTFALFDRALPEALGPMLNSIFGRVDAGGQASHFLRMLPPDPNSRCRSESGRYFCGTRASALHTQSQTMALRAVRTWHVPRSGHGRVHPLPRRPPLRGRAGAPKLQHRDCRQHCRARQQLFRCPTCTTRRTTAGTGAWPVSARTRRTRASWWTRSRSWCCGTRHSLKTRSR